MATKHVHSDALNLRREPQVKDGNIIAELVKGQALSVLGPADTPGWLNVEATIGGTRRQGFVSERLLRDPVSDAKERLISAAVAEWVRFDKGTGQEHLAPYHTFVGAMWNAIGQTLDGRDRDQPWSAAFISWIVRSTPGSASRPHIHGTSTIPSGSATRVHRRRSGGSG
jgi:hypothetical protein